MTCSFLADEHVKRVFIQGIKRSERFVPEDKPRDTIVWLDDWIE